MGCDSPLALPRFSYEGIDLDRCPGYYLKNVDFLKRAFDIHRWKENGFLPYPGTWTDQPNLLIEICDYIDHLLAEVKKREINKQLKK